MATFKSEFQDLATELISDEFDDFRVAFRVFKESDAYDPRTDTGGVGESHDLQAIPLEIEDAERIFSNATNDNIYLVALKAGSSQEFDTSYTAEYDGFLYSIESVSDDPANAAYFFSLVGGSKQKAPQHTTRFAPNFNGISQKGLISSLVSLSSGDTIKFKASKPTSDFATVLDSISRSFRLRYREGGVIQITGVDGTVNGQPIESLVTLWPDGISEFELTIKTTGDINSIGARSDTDASFFDGVIFDFSINDGSIYNFPMDDGWQNNPTMRNTGSGANGTFINMTEAAWQEIPL